MRYQTWDVLVFPARSKIPKQEFRTACYAVQDQEFIQVHSSVLILPTVTSFIPGMPAGDPFRISLHCWENPEPSRFTQNYTDNTEEVVFEARVFVDGILKGTKVFPRTGSWPTIIDTSIDFDKNGEVQPLVFPSFHREMLTASGWSASDDNGRIKVIVSEGLYNATRFERIKNIVAFSFQHAPMEILEASAIAWPNQQMWHTMTNMLSYVPQASPRKGRYADPDFQDHSHSPRRKDLASRFEARGGMAPPPIALSFSKVGGSDPFLEPRESHWLESEADTSMIDGTRSCSSISNSRQVTEPMAIDKIERGFDDMANMQSDGAYESLCEALVPAAPVNTPQNTSDSMSDASLMEYLGEHTITRSQGPQSMNSGIDGMKGRKERKRGSPCTVGDFIHIDTMEESSRSVSRSMGSSIKRPRIVTPVASKVIDKEDQPRNSPHSRRVSRQSTSLDSNGERRVLSNFNANAAS